MRWKIRGALAALGGCCVSALLAASGMPDQVAGPRSRACEPPVSDSGHIEGHGIEGQRTLLGPIHVDPVAHEPRAHRLDETCQSTPVTEVFPRTATTVVPGGGSLGAGASTAVLPGCQSGTAPACQGACPPFNVCQAVRLGSFEICACVGERAVCGTADPLCGGVCPPGLVCAGDVFGFGSCRCESPLPKVGTTTTTIRAAAMTTTTPSPATLPRPACKSSGYPECNGACPQEEVCVAYVDRVAFGNCGCFPRSSAGTPCSEVIGPQCDGACPSGTACMEDPSLNECVCFDVLGAKCGFFGPPACTGECPPATPACRDDGAGGCVCSAD